MRPGAIFINTARGEVVDHAALAAAIREKRLRVGLDVFAKEPAAATGTFDDEIVPLPNVYGTHHIGASTEQAQEAIAAETVRIIRSYKETGRVPNVVNLAVRTPATHMLVVRHRDRPGVLAHVFDHLRRDNLNVQETENIVFEGAEAAVARINLDGAPSAALCNRIKTQNADVLDLQVVAVRAMTARQWKFDAGEDVHRIGGIMTHHDNHTHSQLFRRSGRPAGRGARAGAARHAVAARRRHVGARDQPPLRRLRRDHRGLRGRPAHARRRSRGLPRAVPPGWREPAVLDGADEPAAGRRFRRLRRHAVSGRRRRSRKPSASAP